MKEILSTFSAYIHHNNLRIYSVRSMNFVYFLMSLGKLRVWPNIIFYWVFSIFSHPPDFVVRSNDLYSNNSTLYNSNSWANLRKLLWLFCKRNVFRLIRIVFKSSEVHLISLKFLLILRWALLIISNTSIELSSAALKCDIFDGENK